MRCHTQRLVPMVMTLSLLFLVVMPVWAADPEIDRLLRSPVGKDWVTNGGNLTNQRYSTLKQIDTSNVKNLKGAWMIRLKGSAYGGKYALLTVLKKIDFDLSMLRVASRRHIFEAHVNGFTLVLQVHGAKPFDDLAQQASVRLG